MNKKFYSMGKLCMVAGITFTTLFGVNQSSYAENDNSVSEEVNIYDLERIALMQAYKRMDERMQRMLLETSEINRLMEKANALRQNSNMHNQTSNSLPQVSAGAMLSLQTSLIRQQGSYIQTLKLRLENVITEEQQTNRDISLLKSMLDILKEIKESYPTNSASDTKIQISNFTRTETRLYKCL